ncbi:lysophospholipid acyltransferase family protein [Streptomyces sp. enrichment culture]|uniref:lysophospholipid acyltransferase family protein n=1 Tax=Streptomyces sp. enrichment culture TaxID=1795815 RepID=UPI003F56C345
MSAWLPGAPCTARTCVGETGASALAAARGVLRLAAVLGLLLAAVLGLLLAWVLGLLLAGVAVPPFARRRFARRHPRRIADGLVRRWCRGLVRAAGVRVRVTGTAPPEGGLLLVANHISWLDVPLLAAVRPARMLAKQEIRRWPVAGPLAALGGALFIDRDRLRALPGTVARLADALRSGAAVGVFPEGSTWCGRAQGRFRRAAFQAALEAGVPVQPVRIRYRLGDGSATTRPAFIGEDSLLTSVWRVVTAPALVAEAEVRPALTPGTHPDRRTLARAAEEMTLGPAGPLGHAGNHAPTHAPPLPAGRHELPTP